jgi:hypothetical protein
VDEGNTAHFAIQCSAAIETNRFVSFREVFLRTCAKSYAVCSLSQNPASDPNAFSSRTAISGLIPDF